MFFSRALTLNATWVVCLRLMMWKVLAPGVDYVRTSDVKAQIGPLIGKKEKIEGMCSTYLSVLSLPWASRGVRLSVDSFSVVTFVVDCSFAAAS